MALSTTTTYRMKIKLSLLFISICFFLFSCSFKKYYFPIKDLENGIVYKYECVETPNNTQYWKLTTNKSDQTLVTEAFDSKFKQYEFFKEKITNQGATLLQFDSYKYNDKNELTIVSQKPIDLDVFKWKKKETYKYSVETKDDKYGTIRFQKTREFICKENVTIFGKTHSAIKLKGLYKTELIDSGKIFEYTQNSWYVKNIGLVKMHKLYDDGSTETLILTEVLPVFEWKK